MFPFVVSPERRFSILNMLTLVSLSLRGIKKSNVEILERAVQAIV